MPSTVLEKESSANLTPSEKRAPNETRPLMLSIRKNVPRVVFFFMPFVFCAEPFGAKGRIRGKSIPLFAILSRIL
jgi:hypothetical protein